MKREKAYGKLRRGWIRLVLVCAALSLATGAFSEEMDRQKQSAAAGDIVVFGRYEQDGNAENGPEPVEWLVLEAGETELFLVSRYCLDCRPFHGENISIQWARCDLRKWMNTEMLQALFTEHELALVMETALKAGKHPRYTTSAGKDTTDRLFLLSFEDVERFFPELDDRLGFATPYAKSLGAYVNRRTGASGWWLRTTGHSPDDECRVSSEGHFVNYDVNYELDTVRPAVKIDAEAFRNGLPDPP